ncbi:MAG: YHS domain-containing protein [Fimbriimonadaceae bacterium]|nr:YHS domain-containing protein [Fimbriimonadaceae bacterium]
MFATLAVFSVIAQTADSPLVCPIMSDHAVPAEAKSVEYKGASFQFCCAGCEPKFAADPEKYIKEAAAGNKVVGKYLFDVTTGELLNMRRATMHMDYKGIRYMFSKQESLDKFRANPASFVDNAPKKEALYCPVMKSEVKSYGSASGYVDYKGVRYYMCCAGCTEPFRKDPEQFIGNAARYVKDAKVVQSVPVEG